MGDMSEHAPIEWIESGDYEDIRYATAADGIAKITDTLPADFV